MGSIFQTACAGVVQYFQIGAEFFDFGLPVEHQGGRRHNQAGLVGLLRGFQIMQKSDGLQGFAQAHVVGQAAAQTVLVQKSQPVEAVLLIGAQTGVEAGSQLNIGLSREMVQTLFALV